MGKNSRLIISSFFCGLLIVGCNTAAKNQAAPAGEAINTKQAINEPARIEGEISYLGFADGFWQVFILNSTGHSKITHSQYDKSRVSWFPDGRHLLVNANEGRLYKVNIQTGAESPITTSLKGMTDAVISPDGTRIVFSVSTADGVDGNDLWLINTEGSELRKITQMNWLQHEPAWDTKGEWIYFLSGKGGQTHDIWRVAVSNGATEQLTVGSLYHFDVAVSVDNVMAYSSNRSGSYEIWSQPVNGTARQLTHSEVLDARPDWSPDGQWIAYESARDGIVNIWLMNKDGEAQMQLTDNSVGARFPVWKPTVK